MKKRLWILLSVMLAVLSGCGGKPQNAEPDKALRVATAASLEPVVKHLAWTYQAEHPGVTINIISGPGDGVDLYLPAGEQEMQELVAKKKVDEETITTFLGNKLVIVVPEGRRIIKGFDQLKNTEYKSIAVADPVSVPAGRYAKQVLEKANLWQELQPKMAIGNSARIALTRVAAESADAAFVYRSDAISEDKVHIALEIEDSMHDPIRYPMAVMKNSKQPDLAKDFLNFISSPAAKDRFRQAGFSVEN